MKTWLKDRLDRFRGTGIHAPTVPPMDGTLRPNTLLDIADVVHRVTEPDNLAAYSNRLLFSSGAGLFSIDPGTGAVEAFGHYSAPITAVATHGDQIAIGLLDGSLLHGTGGNDLRKIQISDDAGLDCVTDLAFTAPGTLAVCVGSLRHGADRWKHDLMELGASGRVLQIDIASGGIRELARCLAFPFGAAQTPSGIVISESWRHSLVSLTGSSPRDVLTNLPGYPCRIRASASGGYWLTLFALRNQLIELVLRQRPYRERMMREVSSDHWVAPSLAAATSFMEPLQGGAIRTHGIIKPWAPTRSYGLVVRLDKDFKPVESYHSRADGTHHGIVSVAEVGSDVFVASKGGNALLRLPAVESSQGTAT